MTDGACWNTLSETQKASVVNGIWTGIAGRSIADGLLGEAPSYYFQRDYAAVPDGTNLGDIMGYFDLLYRTPANRRINWDWAYILAAMNARDDDSDDRLPLLAFLRSHGAVPTSGEIVDVKGPDILTVMSNSERFDVHLSGVSSDSLSDAQRQRAIEFLQGLQTSTTIIGECDKTRRTPVRLIYDTQIFRDEKQLTATLRIGQFTAICLGKRKLTIEEFFGQSGADYLNLNSFLVSRGLLRASPEVDTKWPKNIQDSFKLDYSAEHAKKNGLYLHGENRDSVVEEVLAYVKSQQPAAQPPTTSNSESVKEETRPRSGSGFFVAMGVVLTNQHVVAGCPRVVVGNSKGERAISSIRAADEGNDLAILNLDDGISTPRVVVFSGERPAGVGEPITVAGFPLAGLLGSGVTVTTGVISNTAGIGDDIRFMQISAPVQPGNSGGPVLDRRGRLAGIVVSKLDAVAVTQLTGDIPQNVNFAIKESVARAMLDAHGVEYSTAPEAAVDVIETAKAATVFIQCE